MLNQFPLIFPLYSFNTVCLGLKALRAEEERDRLRLDFNELEERVNPDFIFFVSFLCSWCVIFFSLLATGSPFPNSVCMYVYTFVHKHLCTSICATVHIVLLEHTRHNCSLVWLCQMWLSFTLVCPMLFHSNSRKRGK